RITALQEFSKYRSYYLWGYGENFPNENLKNISAASSAFDATNTYSDRMSMRYVGLLSYNFDEKYLLDASYSYQGDSRFSKQYDNFYSIGLGWNIHEENFIKRTDAIDILRLKVGYGLTGNAGIGRNRFQSLITYGMYFNQPAASL